MGRRVALTPQQVERLRENKEGWTNKLWAAEYGVSMVTIIAAKKGHGIGYSFIGGGDNG